MKYFFVILAAALLCSGCTPPRKQPTTRQSCLLAALENPSPESAAEICYVAFPENIAAHDTGSAAEKPNDPEKPRSTYVWYAAADGECHGILLDHTSLYDESWCGSNSLSLANHAWHLMCTSAGRRTATWRLEPAAAGYLAHLVAGVDEIGVTSVRLYKEQADCTISAGKNSAAVVEPPRGGTSRQGAPCEHNYNCAGMLLCVSGVCRSQ